MKNQLVMIAIILFMLTDNDKRHKFIISLGFVTHAFLFDRIPAAHGLLMKIRSISIIAPAILGRLWKQFNSNDESIEHPKVSVEI